MEPALGRSELVNGFRKLGITPGMALEVHSSLRSFGFIDGGANALIEALMQTVGSNGAIVMPSFRLSKNLPLTPEDKALGIILKIRILDESEKTSGMGIVSDTFRKMPGVITGKGIFRVSAWGKNAQRHSEGFGYLIDSGGYALLLGVDIYRLSAMHYVEDALPDEIRGRFKPSPEAHKLYPEDKWLIEAWEPDVKPWYSIQNAAYGSSLITDGVIGDAKCMLFKVKPVIELYREALISDPYGLYGLK